LPSAGRGSGRSFTSSAVAPSRKYTAPSLASLNSRTIPASLTEMVKASASATPSGVRACCRSSSLSLSNSRVNKDWLCMVCGPVRDYFTDNLIIKREILDADRAAVNHADGGYGAYMLHS
jgi:hypothetical protein